MTSEDTENQTGGAVPNDAATDTIAGGVTIVGGTDTIAGEAEVKSAAEDTQAAGNDSSTAIAENTVSSGTIVEMSAHDEHVAGLHQALKNIAADFKALGLDFESATKNAWEAEV